MSRARACLIAAALAGSSGPAAFADDSPASSTEIAGDLLSYYGGERTAAYVVGSLGVAAVGSGAALVTRPQDFARGLGWPLLTLGVLEIAGGISYVVQVNREIAHYQAALGADPSAFQQEELAHIQGTGRRFVYYRLAELGLAVAGAGIATYGAIADRPTFEGIGLGAFAVGLPFFIIDTYNNSRAAWYEGRLSHFDPKLQLQVGAGRAPWSAGVAVAF